MFPNEKTGKKTKKNEILSFYFVLLFNINFQYNTRVQSIVYKKTLLIILLIIITKCKVYTFLLLLLPKVLIIDKLL